MKQGWIGFAVVMFSVIDLRADHRVTFTPSLEIVEVDDDNLNYSPVEPLRDRVRRVTPTLALRFDSPRWSARVSCALDSERYANQRGLDDDRAREQASIKFQYSATPRFSLAIDGGYVGTNTLADLNTDTGLAALRVRGRRFAMSPSAHYRISPTLTMNASASSSVTAAVVNSYGLRSQAESLGIDRHVTPRDTIGLGYEHAENVFSGVGSHRIRSHAVLASWTHDLGSFDRLSLQVGPRLTEGSRSADFGASLSHRWHRTSLALILMRTQTTVIGYAGNAQTNSLQMAFTYTPMRNMTMYVSPAIFRTTHDRLQGSVYRLTAGTRYALTSFLDADVSYNRDNQNGALDPLQPNAKISHSALTVGLTTGWNRSQLAR